MSLESGIKETSQKSTNHGVTVCKNSSTIQAYFYFSEDCLYLQFSAVNTSLRDIGNGDIHFLPFSSRENWRRYRSTYPLVNGKAAFRGDLKYHTALSQFQDLRSLTSPTNITSPPATCEHSTLHLWDQTSPVASSRPAFSALIPMFLTPYSPSSAPFSSTTRVDINAVVQVVFQATLVANAASIAANPPAPPPVPTPTQPAGGHQPSPLEKFFIKACNGYLY